MNQPPLTNEQYYLIMWKEMLSAFLGWTEARVHHWLQERDWITALSDPNDLLFHQTPQYWIAPLLIPNPLKQQLSGSELVDLQQRIFLAFNDHHRYEFPAGTDWLPYREKVERILAGYGATLPTAPD